MNTVAAARELQSFLNQLDPKRLIAARAILTELPVEGDAITSWVRECSEPTLWVVSDQYPPTRLIMRANELDEHALSLLVALSMQFLGKHCHDCCIGVFGRDLLGRVFNYEGNDDVSWRESWILKLAAAVN